MPCGVGESPFVLLLPAHFIHKKVVGRGDAVIGGEMEAGVLCSENQLSEFPKSQTLHTSPQTLILSPLTLTNPDVSVFS